jgi:hypothetical protein
LVLKSTMVILMLLANHASPDSGVKNPYGGQENRDGQSSQIKCTISPSDLTWRNEAAGTSVFVAAQCQGIGGFTVLSSLHLTPLPTQSGPDHGEYWAPFNLTTGASTKKSQVVSPAAGTQTRSVRLLPTTLLWASTKSSDWPAQDFAKTVPAGRYILRLELEVNGGKTVASNEIQINILK